jgi:hypothetical protein
VGSIDALASALAWKWVVVERRGGTWKDDAATDGWHGDRIVM